MRCMHVRKGAIGIRWLCVLAAAASAIAYLASWRWNYGLDVCADHYVGVGRGCVLIGYVEGVDWAEFPKQLSARMWPRHPKIQMLHLGTFVRQPSAVSSYTTVELALPLWMLTLVFIAPAAWLWVNRRKLRPTDCKRCGYDLRGLAGNKCPECGSPRGDQATPAAGEA